jgi:hypothetical protein
MNKIDDFSTHFNHLNLKYENKIKGFDPSNISMDHMQSMGFSSAFTQTILSKEEEGNNQDTPLQDVDDIETLISTTDRYRKRGKGPNEKGTQSLEVLMQEHHSTSAHAS